MYDASKAFLAMLLFLFAETSIASAAITDAKATDVESTLAGAVSGKFDCGGKTVAYEQDGPHGYFKLLDPCDLKINYRYEIRVAPDPDHPDAQLLARADRVVVQSPGEIQTVYSAPLRKSAVKTLSSSDWWASSKFQVGQQYEIRVIYRLIEVSSPTKPAASGNATGTPEGAAGTSAPPETKDTPPTEKDVDEISVTALRFVPIKNWLTLQLTGKIFTAWQPKPDGDVSFVVPGIAAGLGARYAKDFNDQDVLGLRFVAAAGPNLVARQTVNKDANGQVTGIASKQSLQVLLGGEFVLGRYLSAGVAHGVLKGAAEDGWLILLSYGELYPATSTK